MDKPTKEERLKHLELMNESIELKIAFLAKRLDQLQESVFSTIKELEIECRGKDYFGGLGPK